MKKDINVILEERISLGTTYKALQSMGIKNPSLELFKTQRFKKYLDSLDEDKKMSFYKTVGGNYWKRVKEILE